MAGWTPDGPIDWRADTLPDGVRLTMRDRGRSRIAALTGGAVVLILAWAIHLGLTRGDGATPSLMLAVVVLVIFAIFTASAVWFHPRIELRGGWLRYQGRQVLALDGIERFGVGRRGAYAAVTAWRGAEEIITPLVFMTPDRAKRVAARIAAAHQGMAEQGMAEQGMAEG